MNVGPSDGAPVPLSEQMNQQSGFASGAMSTTNGGTPAAEAPPDDIKDADLEVPVEMKMKFLRALRDRDLKSALSLCQIFLVYDPEDPVASEFLSLIQEKLREDEDAEESSEEEDEDDDEDSDSNSEETESDGDSSQSSSCCCSSSSSSPSDDEEEEKQVNRHKRCPPTNIYL